MNGRIWRDLVLGVFALQWGLLGFWAVLAPRSFYDDFPGAGRSWISVDGPYNEHLVRDVGALFLALAVVNAMALAHRSAALVRTAGAAVAVFSVPHVAYHLANNDVLSTSDAWLSTGPLAVGLALGVALVISPGARA